MQEIKYIEHLCFCKENNLICLEFYRRNKEWKKKMEEQLKRKVSEYIVEG